MGTVGDGYFWHFEWMRGGSVYRDLPYEVTRDQSWSPLEFMPVGGECYVIAQTVLQEDEEGTDRAVAAAVYRWTDAGVEQIAAIPDYGERTEITVLGDAFSVYKRETGVMQIYRYDGTPLQTYRFEPESAVMSVLRAKDDTLYVVNSRRYAGDDGADTVYASKRKVERNTAPFTSNVWMRTATCCSAARCLRTDWCFPAASLSCRTAAG